MDQNNSEVLAVLDVSNRNFSLKCGNYTVGRDSEEYKHDISIDHESIDIKHAALEIRLYGVKIIDLFSKNGTFIDEEDIGKLNFFDINKSVPVRFGQVNGQFRLITESESGFLGFNTSRDNSDIIPRSPEVCNEEKENSQLMGRSRYRKASHKTILSFNEPSTSTSHGINISSGIHSPVIVQSTQTNDNNGDIFANITDENIRRNIEQMQEEDDFYVPETQEIFGKRNETIDSNSQTMVRLPTQEFIYVDEKSNDSDNLLQNLDNVNCSQVIPLVTHSPVLVNEIKDDIDDNKEEIKEENPSQNKGYSNNITDVRPSVSCNERIDNDDDDDETDADEEIMSVLNWSESRTLNLSKKKSFNAKSTSVTPDLDLNVINQEEIERDSVTPDLDFIEQRSGSVTPDLECGENVRTTNTIETENFSGNSPTQAFIPKALAESSNSKTIQEKVNSLNISPSNKENSEPNLDETQVFVFNNSTDKSRTSNLNLSKNNSLNSINDSVFLKPNSLQKTRNSAKTSCVELSSSSDDDDLGPTQPFLGKPGLLSNNGNDDDDDDSLSLETTQPFHFIRPGEKNRIEQDSSPPLLDSDEDENNSEFCLRDTLVVGEETDLLKTNEKEQRNILFSSSDEDKILTKRGTARSKNGDSPNNSKSKNKSNVTRESPQLFGDDNFDIQQTPDVDFLKLPNTNEIKEAGALFSRMCKGKKRNKILLEESSNDESSSDEDDTTSEDVTKRDKPDDKPSEAKAKGKYPTDLMRKFDKRSVVILKKSNTSMSPEEDSDKKQKRKCNTEKHIIPAKAKNSIIKLKEDGNVPSTSSSRNTAESELFVKQPRDMKDIVSGALKNPKERSEDIKSKDSKKETQTNQKITENPQDGNNLRMKSSRLKKNVDPSETKSINGDYHATSVSRLATRTSSRTKSVPSRIDKDYLTEKDFETDEILDFKHSTRKGKQLKTICISSEKSSATDDVSPEKNRVKRNEKQNSTKFRVKYDKLKETSSESHENEHLKITEKVPRTSRASRSDETKSVNEEDNFSTRGRLRRKVSRLISSDLKESPKIVEQHSEKSTRRNQMKEKIKDSENSRKRKGAASTDGFNVEDVKKARPTRSRSAVAESKPSSGNVENIRKSARQANNRRIAFTRVDSAQYSSAIQRIGGTIVDSPQECTVLVAEKFIRTWKFLAAMAKGVPIVSQKWLENFDEDLCDDSFSSYDDYLIRDTAAERHYKFSLKKSIYLARKKPIFKNYEFILTPNTRPTPTEMIQIIECGGGVVLEKLPKDLSDHSHFYIISDKTDISYWHRFRRALPGVQIVNTEAIMLAVIQQCINFKNYLLP